MRIGLVMENSQGDKNPLVYECLKEVASMAMKLLTMVCTLQRMNAKLHM